MTNVDLARVEFAFVTINHFFVPVTIGLAFLTALLQTAWYRTSAVPRRRNGAGTPAETPARRSPGTPGKLSRIARSGGC